MLFGRETASCGWLTVNLAAAAPLCNCGACGHTTGCSKLEEIFEDGACLGILVRWVSFGHVPSLVQTKALASKLSFAERKTAVRVGLWRVSDILVR